MKILTLLLIFLSSNAFSQARTFCERNRGDILEIMKDREARISFKNGGGIANGGVCWWHSRLQRSSFFLARFAPSAARPDSRRVRQILSELRQMDKVVTIPGYSDFRTFSRAHQKDIQRLLNDWQLFDGIHNFQWLRGISGKPALPPHEMEERMNSVYKSFRESPASMWIMAQMEGITSHSFLVLQMVKVNGGYDLDLIDSNHPLEVVSVRYQEGDQFLQTNKGSRPFVPYVGFQEDFRKIAKSLRTHCRNKSLDLLPDFFNIQDGEIEISTRDDRENISKF